MLAPLWSTPPALLFLDGGQAPFGVYTRVLASGDFNELPGTGSLRLLRRVR